MYLPMMLDLLKKAMRKQSFVVRQSAQVLSFWLLDKLAREKNTHSGVLFKRMIFSLLEHHSDQELRHSLADGLRCVLSTFPNVPVDQLALPLIKQLQAAEDITYIFNVFDLELVGCLALHPKLSAGCGATILEYLITFSLKNLAMTAALMQTIEKLLQRFSS